MEKVSISVFTDPMMGLSYECEPMFRKLETHFAGRIEFRSVMNLLVKDVRDFMTWEERALPPVEGIRKYNTRLAEIYKSEESISGMPINMEGFRLFDEEHTSSMPLNLAYKAAELTSPEKAARFLYNLRYATIVETRPTTHLKEIMTKNSFLLMIKSWHEIIIAQKHLAGAKCHCYLEYENISAAYKHFTF